MARRPRISPVVWTPPPRSERARRRTGDDPFPPLHLIPLNGDGPEDVVVDAQGWLLTGVGDGRILRVHPEGTVIQTVGDTGGRPLGLEVLPDGGVLVCDSDRGLLRLDPRTGAISSLTDRVGGERLVFCSNAVAAADGTIYFTESTSRFGFAHWKAAIVEHSGTGRLFRRDPDGSVEVLLGGLQFANGLVLDPEESSVVVAETGAYRLTRCWLQGERAGASDVLIDLPGFPDNLSVGRDGTIWIAMANPRDPAVDWLHRHHPILRQVVWALPARLQPQAEESAWVMGVSFDGRVVRDLQATGAGYRMVTGVAETDGRLYLASIAEAQLAVLDLNALRG